MAEMFHNVDPAQWKRCWQGIPYTEGPGDERQVLDIYLPDEGDGPFPLIVFVHGGGWVSGDRRANTMPGAFKVTSQGYAVAFIEYRLAPNVTWPAPCCDVKCGIRFLRAHADEYKLKTDKIAIWGNSAGGHISNMVAATGKRHLQEDLSMGWADQTSDVQCIVDLYSPADMYQIDVTNVLEPEENAAITGTGTHAATAPGMDLPHNIVAGFQMRANPAAAQYLSPINYITPDFPPAYYLHGIADPIVPYVQSVGMKNMVNEACGKGHAKLELFDGATHGDPVMKTDEVTNRILDFIDEYLWDGKHERTPLPELKLLED